MTQFNKLGMKQKKERIIGPDFGLGINHVVALVAHTSYKPMYIMIMSSKICSILMQPFSLRMGMGWVK